MRLPLSKNRDEVLKSVRSVYDFDDEMVLDVAVTYSEGLHFHERISGQRGRVPRPGFPKNLRKNNDTSSTDRVEEPFRPSSEKSLTVRFDNLLGVAVSTATFSAAEVERIR